MNYFLTILLTLVAVLFALIFLAIAGVTYLIKKKVKIRLIVSPTEIRNGSQREVKFGIRSPFGIFFPQERKITIPNNLVGNKEVLYSKLGYRFWKFKGNLIVSFEIDRGVSIHQTLIVSREEALKGTIKSLVVEDRKIKVKIPANIQSDTVLKIPKQGKIKYKERGNLYLTIKIDGVDCFHEIWINEEEKGTLKSIRYKDKKIKVKIPPDFEDKITLCLRKLGDIGYKESGDLYLTVKIDKGKNIFCNTWVNEENARKGIQKSIVFKDEWYDITIPPNSNDRDFIRIKGAGEATYKNRGDLLIYINVYPEVIEVPTVTEKYVEPWIKEQIRNLMSVFYIGTLRLPLKYSSFIAKYEKEGLSGVLGLVQQHMYLESYPISIAYSDTITKPGEIIINEVKQNNRVTSWNCQILVNQEYCAKPSALGYILGHECSHVFLQKNYPYIKVLSNNEKEKLTDIVTLMFGFGEYYLRASKKGIYLGYLDPHTFGNLYNQVTLVFGRWLSTPKGDMSFEKGILNL